MKVQKTKITLRLRTKPLCLSRSAAVMMICLLVDFRTELRSIIVMASPHNFRNGADKLVGWLASEFDENGVSRSEPENIQFYYKMPATFAYCGRRDLAIQTLDQFRSKFPRVNSDPEASG